VSGLVLPTPGKLLNPGIEWCWITYVIGPVLATPGRCFRIQSQSVSLMNVKMSADFVLEGLVRFFYLPPTKILST
jgi:hypothetical protein